MDIKLYVDDMDYVCFDQDYCGQPAIHWTLDNPNGWRAFRHDSKRNPHEYGYAAHFDGFLYEKMGVDVPSSNDMDTVEKIYLQTIGEEA